MVRLTLVAAVSLLVSCADGDTDTTFVFPEICGNGIDDNGNGLIDCADSTFCGGSANCGGTTDTGPDTNEGPLEIDFTDGQCDFLFSENDCQKLVCTIPVTNNTDEDGTVSASCENPIKDNYDTVIQFRNVQVGPQRLNALSASPIEAESSATIELYYNCFMPTGKDFTTGCTIAVDADDRSEDRNFTIEGISTD